MAKSPDGISLLMIEKRWSFEKLNEMEKVRPKKKKKKCQYTLQMPAI